MNDARLNTVSVNSAHVNCVSVDGALLGDVATQPKPPKPKIVDTWFMSGRTNQDADRDKLIGEKGNILTLRNFIFGGMSGYNGYLENFNSWSLDSTYCQGSYNNNSIHVTKILQSSSSGFALFYYKRINAGDSIRVKMNIKVSGLDTVNNNKCTFGNVTIVEGVNLIDTTYVNNLDSAQNLAFRIQNYSGDCNVTIEQIPEYAGYLCFDGIDDNCICTTLPILSDYTLIVRRKIIKNIEYSYLCGKGKSFSAFSFMFENASNTITFGKDNPITIVDNEVSWQTKESYNGHKLNVGNAIDYTDLLVGKGSNYTSICWNGVIGYVELWDVSLTKEEIDKRIIELDNEWQKKIPKNYPIDLSYWFDGQDGVYPPNKILIYENRTNDIYWMKEMTKGESVTFPAYDIKIAGMGEGSGYAIAIDDMGSGTLVDLLNVTEDGTYSIPSYTYTSPADGTWCMYHIFAMLSDQQPIFEVLPL